VEDVDLNKPDLKKKTDAYKHHSDEVAELREVSIDMNYSRVSYHVL